VTTVSVLTPTYNRAEVLWRAIESVHQQRYQKYEHIIVDDGSTDDTRATVQACDHDRLRYTQLSENRGVAAALNRGIEISTGEYISFLDSDDVYFPDRLAETSRILDSAGSNVGGVYHRFRRTSDGSVGGHVPKTLITQSDLADRNLIVGNSNTMYRADAVDTVGGFDESFDSAVDYDFQLRLAEHFDLVGIDRVLARKDDTVSGIQDNPEVVRQGERRLLAKHQSVLTASPVSQRYYRIGIASLALNEPQIAHHTFQSAIVHCPDADRLELRYRIGNRCLDSGFDPLARWYLWNTVRRRPSRAKAWVLLFVTLSPVQETVSLRWLRALRNAFGRS